jgi:hypothetical protein
MKFRLRNAEPADAEAIARVQVTSWHETYAKLVPAEMLASLSIERRTAA